LSEKVPLPNHESEDDNQKGYLGSTPAAGQLPPRGERFWVERPEQLLHAASKLSLSPVIAIDAEFTQVRSRTQPQEGISSVPRLALLQLAIDKCCFVVDTLRLQDLSPLAAVVGNPDCITLLHGAGADLRVMAERNLYVAHYYDLEATCRSIFGQHESSLAAMLQRAFHSHLDKSLQRTDWTRRPLPPAMIAYAARDAEVTLALYYWLKQHYNSILQVHENTLQADTVASWIEPFLRGTATNSPEVAVAEARSQGVLQKKLQIVSDCREALASVTHPMRRNRLLRLITDLSLVQMAPDILSLLQAPTSDERAGSARALGRLGIQSAREPLQLLLQDPVQDVRKAAQTALHNLDEKDQRQHRSPSSKAGDGSRTWVVENTEPSGASDDDQSWKARLRSMIDS
jgi:3'-5' exonuclease